MTFQIPESFDGLSPEGIAGLVEVARNEFAALKAAVTPETVTDEQLDRLRALQTFWFVDAPAELAARRSRLDEFAALADPTATATTTATQTTVTVTASATAPAAEPEVIVPTINDIITANGGTSPAPTPEVPAYAPPRTATLVASAGVPDFEAGQKLPTLLDVAKAFEARSRSHGGGSLPAGVGPISYPVAQLVRDFPPEFSMEGDATDYAKLLHVIDERRLPGGSLLASDRIAREQIRALGAPGADAMVASAGWCAPSETDYSICLNIDTDGMWNAPEVQARRGGVRHNTGLEFDTIFGTCISGSPVATGFFNLSEAQVAAGVTKSCLEIPCPDFVDTRLGVTGLCLTGNILSIRGYPEYTEAFTRGALAVSQHQINALQIAAVVAGSTAVTLTGNQPWTSDGTVVSQVMSAVEMAIVDIKYRLRANQKSTLEVVMPFWVLAQMRADWIRRNGHTGAGTTEALTLADNEISSAFAARGARVQYVYDWQDAFSTCAATGAPGADTPITELPTSLSFIVYPAGTWVKALQNVITLNSIYDSTKLATNQVTHLFTEDGWAVLRMCPISRVYTVNICPSGSTGNVRAVTC